MTMSIFRNVSMIFVIITNYIEIIAVINFYYIILNLYYVLYYFNYFMISQKYISKFHINLS